MAEKAQADPFALWRDWVADSERQWNAFLNNAMATDEFSQAMGRFMDIYLNMQKSMNEVMGRYLQSANMPTRNDILALGERLSQIDDRLGRLETAIAAGLSAKAPPSRTPASAPARPPRTRKPARS